MPSLFQYLCRLALRIFQVRARNIHAKLSALVVIGIITLGGISLSRGQDSDIATANVQWRRTVDGWERADLWTIGNLASDVSPGPTAPLPPPSMHPILLAMLMLAAAGLLAVPSGDRR